MYGIPKTYGCRYQIPGTDLGEQPIKALAVAAPTPPPPLILDLVRGYVQQLWPTHQKGSAVAMRMGSLQGGGGGG